MGEHRVCGGQCRRAHVDDAGVKVAEVIAQSLVQLVGRVVSKWLRQLSTSDPFTFSFAGLLVPLRQVCERHKADVIAQAPLSLALCCEWCENLTDLSSFKVDGWSVDGVGSGVNVTQLLRVCDIGRFKDLWVVGTPLTETEIANVHSLILQLHERLSQVRHARLVGPFAEFATKVMGRSVLHIFYLRLDVFNRDGLSQFCGWGNKHTYRYIIYI